MFNGRGFSIRQLQNVSVIHCGWCIIRASSIAGPLGYRPTLYSNILRGDKMIFDVVTKNLKLIPDERGRLMEILRRDEEMFSTFGQVYLTTTYPGVVKAWHYHKMQDDHIVCVKGMLKLVLYDDRDDSPTKGEINQFFIGDFNPALIRVPRMVYHGWKCISEEEALVINIPTEPYDHKNPDEYRLDPHDNNIPYSWERKDG
jgi:dTDP-4-dehydrorhamnose 3,5-epimerase